MRLRALSINRLPGIRPGFSLDDLAPGINVITGPNASGKSSLARAMRALLDPELARATGLDIEAMFEDDHGELRVLRSGADLSWSRAGRHIETPPLPDSRFLSCYLLQIEDLLVERPADSDIATRIARELAGGYDLPAIRDSDPFTIKSNHGRSEAQALSTAVIDHNVLLQQRAALQREEAELEALQQQKRAADHARHDAEVCQRALALLEGVRHRLTLEQQLTTFPDGMEHLHGDDIEQLIALQGDQARLRDALADARRECEARTTTLVRTGLDTSPLDTARIADQRPALQRLHQVENDLAHQHGVRVKACVRRDEARQALGGKPDKSPALDPATLREVERQLDDLRSADARIAGLEARLRSLPDTQSDSGPDSRPGLDRLREARSELWHWMSAPRAAARTAIDTLALIAVLLAAVAAIATASVLLHPAATVLLLPLAWGLYRLSRRGADGDSAREQACERFKRTGIETPTEWSDDAVLFCLEAIENELRAATRQSDQADERGRLERELDEPRRAREQLLAGLRETAARVGFDPQAIDASLVRWLQLVGEHDRAAIELAEIEAKDARLTVEGDALRAGVMAFLARHDAAPSAEDIGTNQVGAALLDQRLDQLANRLQTRDEMRRLIADSEREIKRLGESLAEQERRLAALYQRARLDDGDEDTLRHRHERLAEWQQLNRRLQDARTLEAERRRPLADHPDLLALVDAEDETALQTRLDHARDEAAQSESLLQTITRIDTDISRAGHDRALEQALARRQAAADALHERRDEALFAEAGRFLLDDIAAEFVRERQPPELRIATEWFGRFTHHQYELVFDADNDPPFSALDTVADERRRLSELSSGTRMQLLLAVRIAFATATAEHGRESLPLLLDEALTTADPERFRAIADSLRELAADGRQVFYLTAQPSDVADWRALDPTIRFIDLGVLRGMQQSITDPQALALPVRPPLPAPDGHDAAAYAVLLGIHPLDPWAPVTAIPVFHLLRDDLELVRRLHELGIERVGPLRALLASTTAAAVLDEHSRQRLQARCDGAEAWLEAWRVGRGRPVDRHALEASGAVSATFIDAVAARCAELGGDGQALITGLEAGDVNRFHQAKREELAQWLAEHGHIDEREPLTDAEIGLHVIAALQSRLDDGSDNEADAVNEGQALADSLEAARRAAASLAVTA